MDPHFDDLTIDVPRHVDPIHPDQSSKEQIAGVDGDKEAPGLQQAERLRCLPRLPRLHVGADQEVEHGRAGALAAVVAGGQRSDDLRTGGTTPADQPEDEGLGLGDAAIADEVVDHGAEGLGGKPEAGLATKPAELKRERRLQERRCGRRPFGRCSQASRARTRARADGAVEAGHEGGRREAATWRSGGRLRNWW